MLSVVNVKCATSKKMSVLCLLFLMAGCELSRQASDRHNPEAGPDDLNLATMIQPVTDENLFSDPNNHNWGASIVKGEDGKYHLFYAQMAKKHSFGSWLTDGVISHAVADSPTGPYQHKEVVLSGRGHGHWDAYTAHNPRIKYFEGKYYLYYMSTNSGDVRLSEQELNQARFGKAKEKLRELLRRNQRIGVAVADSVNGPWQRLEQPIVEPAGPVVNTSSNAAIARHPSGYYVMLFKGDKPNQTKLVRSQAVATAPTPVGPWEVLPNPAVGDLNSEDPSIWYDAKRERFYGIYHAFGYMGLITSVDGFSWQKAKNYKVIEGKGFQHAVEGLRRVGRFERPFVYVENGIPVVLSVAVKPHYNKGDSYSLFIPLSP